MKIMRKSIGLFLCVSMLLSFTAWAQEETACPMFGDSNSDNKITSSDALRALQIAVSDMDYELNPKLPAAADTRSAMPTLYLLDVNGDYRITTTDALLILQRSVRKIESFPVDSMDQYGGWFQEDHDKWVESNVDIVEINETNFPDDVFRDDVSGFDLDGNGWLSKGEISQVTEIDVHSSDPDEPTIDVYPPPFVRPQIKSLRGIEYFTALKVLDCFGNELTQLDLSRNTALTSLSCGNNPLSTLDVSHNTALTYLECLSGNLSSLDVSKNTELTVLNCVGNKLTALNLSENVNIKSLFCSYNSLEVLDVRCNPALERVSCGGNRLSELDVSCNTALEVLCCEENSLNKLDVSKNASLMSLDCSSNNLSLLDLSQNTLLTDLNCKNNPLTELDLTHNTALERLLCGENVHVIGWVKN